MLKFFKKVANTVIKELKYLKERERKIAEIERKTS